MRDILMAIHIGGAIMTAILIAGGFAVLIKRNAQLYRSFAVLIGCGGGFQMISGVLLALAGNGTIFSFCAKVALYTGIVLISEMSLLAGMRSIQMPFPKMTVAVPLCAGVAASFGAIIIISLR